MLRVSVQMWPSECYLGLEQLQSFCLHEGRSAKLACPKREPHFSCRSALSPDADTSFGGNSQNTQSCNAG